MKKIKLIDLLAIAICVAPIIFWLIQRDSLNERIPIHWGLDGKPNGWTSKEQLPVFLASISALGLGIYFLLRFLKEVDPKRTARMNENVAVKIGIGVVTLMSAINILVLMPDIANMNLTKIMFVLISLLFSFLGNVMYNIKPNYFIGIRLPWTLEDPENWRQTHRLTGVLWFVAGIVSAIVMLFLQPWAMAPVFIGVTIVIVLIPSIYSFVLFKRAKVAADKQAL